MVYKVFYFVPIVTQMDNIEYHRFLSISIFIKLQIRVVTGSKCGTVWHSIEYTLRFD